VRAGASAIGNQHVSQVLGRWRQAALTPLDDADGARQFHRLDELRCNVRVAALRHPQARHDGPAETGVDKPKRRRKAIDFIKPVEAQVRFAQDTVEQASIAAAGGPADADQRMAAEILPGDASPSRQGMIAMADKHVRIIKQMLKIEIGFRRIADVDAELRLAAADAFKSLRNQAVEYAQSDERKFCSEFPDDAGQEMDGRAWQRCDGDLTALLMFDAPDRDKGRIELLQQAPCHRFKRPAGGRGKHAPRRSLKQRHVKLGFKALNPSRERRLRQIQMIGRLVKASELVDGEKGAQIEQVEIDAHRTLKVKIFALVNSRNLLEGWA